MNKKELIEQWKEVGKRWEKGEIEGIDFGKGKYIKFSKKQKEFISSKRKFCLYSGGYGCGKTISLIVKMALHCLCFPGTRILVGRQFLSDIERVLLPDFFELLPENYYHYRVKDGIIRFFNGSEAILFGLDAAQSGSDIKKAEQKIRSLNISAFFIDQLEEINYSVFEALTSRIRRTDTPFRQFNGTTNPANYWGYRFFIEKKVCNKNGEWIESKKKRSDYLIPFVVQGSMLDNKEHLPPDYIEEQLSKNETYVKRYVLGEWDMDLLVKGAVFDNTSVTKIREVVCPPEIEENGCKIWEQPNFKYTYQIGVDPSEGVVDPGVVSVVCKQTGMQVAKFRGKLPIYALAEKLKFLYFKYNQPLIIPEVNQGAILEYIRDLNVYRRTIFDKASNMETKKLGWKTSHSNKLALIDNFKKLLRAGFPKIKDANLVEEMAAFVWTDEARKRGAGATAGCHDDDVMATMLSYWGLEPIDVRLNIIKQELKKSQNMTPKRVPNRTFI